MGENLWRNWVGNQACSPSAIAAPGGEDEIASLVVAAEGRGEGVRVAAAGHSVTPLVATDGLLLDLRNLRGVRSIDAARRRAVAGPATTVGDFGDPLWAERLALENQGDIDTQQIAGAVATATHGSGLALGSFSATVRRVRLVTGRRQGDRDRRGRAGPAPRCAGRGMHAGRDH